MENEGKKNRKRQKKNNEQIRKQMEFYFGDANMGKDRYLKKLVDTSSDGFVDLHVFLSFNKLRALGCEDINTLAKAVKSSKMLKVSDDGESVKRVTEIRDLRDVDDRTIYVEGLPSSTDHSAVSAMFSCYGRVSYVSLPRYRTTGDLKGFGFVEFATVEAAKLALEKMKSDEEEKLHCFPKAGSKDCQRLEKQAQSLGHEPMVQEPVDMPPKKRPHSDSESESDDLRKKKIKFESEESESDSAKSKDKKSKKRKNGTTESEVPEKKMKKELSPVKGILKTSNKSDSETEEKKHVTMPEKKKRRKQKKKNKEEKKPAETKLRVISKKEWLELREEYLTSQKLRMSSLKKTLHRARNAEQESDSPPKKEDRAKRMEENDKKIRYEYKADVIVRVQAECTPLHRKALKEELNGGEGIAYIDLHEGSLTCHVRCHDAQAAAKLLKTDVSGMALSLLQGEEERVYWQKMNADREKKLSQPRRGKKKRGQQKIKDKAEKVTMATDAEMMTSSPLPQKHVYFDDK